jgi:hypothetical protein
MPKAILSGSELYETGQAAFALSRFEFSTPVYVIGNGPDTLKTLLAFFGVTSQLRFFNPAFADIATGYFAAMSGIVPEGD